MQGRAPSPVEDSDACPSTRPAVALVVLPEWCDKIFYHGKRWEIRSCACKKHLGERVAIARSGTQRLVGEAVIRESRKISREELAATRHLHHIDDISAVRYRNIHAWILDEVCVYERPIPYRHTLGCVNWVDLQKSGPQQRGRRKRKADEDGGNLPGQKECKRAGRAQCRNQECQFGVCKAGGRGTPYRPPNGNTRFEHCVFCSSEAFNAAIGDNSGRHIHRSLARLAKADSRRHELALERVREMHGPEMALRFNAANKRWKDVLNFRRSTQRLRQQAVAVADWETRQSKDRQRLQRKFPAVYGEAAREESLWMRPDAVAFRRWCLEGSWCMCASCGRMLPQAYHARKLHRKTASKPEAPACAYCRTAGQSGYWAPCPEDVPRRLRKLSPEIVEALRPFDVHTGGSFRAPNGYLVHADMMRFSFKRVSVQAALAALPKKERKRGEKALIYLLDSTESSYARFWRLHERFLAHRASAIERGETWRGAPVKRMPANFIETTGLECALWPHLYWTTSMAETYVRSRDARRLQRRRREASDDEDEQDDDAEIEQAAGRRQSAKASFLAKAHSAVIGYNTDSQLLQFIYDLWLFTTIGGAKNTAGVGIREALASKPYSPDLWRT